MKTEQVAYDNLKPPKAVVRVTFCSKRSFHTRLIKKSTLLKHGYRIDEERGLLVKVAQ